MFLALHGLFELLANWDPVFLAGALAQVAPDLAHDRYARISFFVNAMTESHYLGFLRQLIFQPTFSTIGGFNFIEHSHRLFIRAAVQRSFQSGACARPRR